MNGTRSLLLVLRIAALAVILTILSGIGSLMLPGTANATAAETEAAPPAAPPPSFLATVVGVMLLQTIALAYPALRSTWGGWKLVGALFVLHFGTVTFQSQIESLVYLGKNLPDGMLVGLFAMGLFTAAAFAPLAVVVLGRWRAAPSSATSPGHHEPALRGEWAWKVTLGGLVFLALYYLFGYYVAWKNPEVREFYGGTDPGSFIAQMRGIIASAPWMLPFQFARGVLWVGLAALVVRMMRGAWWEVAIAVSVLFTVPVAYLLFPNPLMPEAVRMTHLVETAPYQFLFAWFIVWLLPGSGGRQPVAHHG